MKTNLQTSNIGKTFAKYVSLNVLSMLGLSAYILADTFFVANNVGNAGITAMNIVLPFFSLLNGSGIILGIGGATRYSTARGAGDKEKADRIFSEVTIVALVLGLIWTLLGTIGAKFVCRALGADESVIELSVEYLRAVSYFGIPFVFNHVLQAFVRNDGAPTLAMGAMLASSFGNVIMDWFLMYPCGLGMFGAAFATGFSSLVSISVMSVLFLRKKNNFHFRRPRFSKDDIAFVFKTGLPSFVTEMSNGVVILFFNNVIYKLAGNVGISAYSVVANIALVALFCFNGVGQGIQPLISYNYGAGKTKNVNKSLLYGAITVFCLGALFYLGFVFGREGLVTIFNKDGNAEMSTLGQQGILLYCISFFASGMNLVCCSYFASINKQIFSFAISISRGMILPIGLVFLCSSMFGLTGVWLVIPIAEFVTLTVSGILLYISKRQSKKSIELAPQVVAE
ncbi:MAG: MATE family efflux transporter [Clostridia bacterium]